MAVVTKSNISSSLPSSGGGSSMMELSSRCVSEVSPSSAPSWVTEAAGLVPWICVCVCVCVCVCMRARNM